jgi:SAM-dependent methyltransferase
VIKKRLKDFWVNFRYRKFSHPHVFDWGWGGVRYNRISLVNFLVSKTGGWNSRYLEIGCNKNRLFDAVSVQNKVGVDPVRGGTLRVTSDEFFAKNAEEFDVIFLDGLHEYQQLRKDTLNALECLAPGGWIVFHDLLPSSWINQHVPRITSKWNGDCWKVAVELASAEGLEFFIVRIDEGVGVLKKVSEQYHIPDQSSELSQAGFDVFVNEVQKLPIVEIEAAIELFSNSEI